jgi:tetratricopeptide (TPR) repeat protein
LAYFNLGIMAQRDGSLDDSIRYYNSAIRVSPNSVGFHRALGTALQAQGHIEEAGEQFRQEELLLRARRGRSF